MAKENEAKDEISVEEGFEKLEELIEGLEDPDVKLEESFTLYEEGVRLLKDLNGRIDAVEKKVQMLRADGGMDDFDGAEDDS